MDVIPAIDVEAGRSRVVYWPGASAGVGRADRPARIASRSSSSPRARGSCTSSTSTAPSARAPANLEAVGAVAARVAVPLQLAGGLEEPDHVRLAFAAGATRVVLSIAIVERPDALRRLPRRRRRLARRGPGPAARTGSPRSRGGAASTPTLDALVEELVARGVHRLVLSHGGRLARRRR